MNGQIVPEEQATVSVFDRSFLYGDGCFEGIRAYNGRIFKLAAHLRRMYQSAETIRLKPAYSPDDIAAAIRETVKANHLTDAYIRLIFTRGAGTLGLLAGVANLALGRLLLRRSLGTCVAQRRHHHQGNQP